MTDAQPPIPRKPVLWVPSLYFCQGIPNALVTGLSVVMYRDLGVDRTSIAFFVSLLSLPWMLKPFWSPVVDMRRTKRLWIVAGQFTVAASLVVAALTLLTPNYFYLSLLLLLVVAFASATHDIAADGFYMMGLNEHDQAWWSGLRNTFFRVAVTFGAGWLILFDSRLDSSLGKSRAWTVTILAAAGIFLLFSFWHAFVLPRPPKDGPVRTQSEASHDYLEAFATFIQKPGAMLAIAFILLYRLDEAQISKAFPLFCLDPVSAGGLGLTKGQYAVANGIYGISALTLGGLAGGFLVAQCRWKKMLPWMLAAMYLPKAAYIFLAHTQPPNFAVVCGAIALEQFGYGFGFTAFMLYLLYFARGSHRTPHYAICTGFMTFGLIVPGSWSGALVTHLGYRMFFNWVFWCGLPGLLLALKLKVDPEFGKKLAR